MGSPQRERAAAARSPVLAIGAYVALLVALRVALLVHYLFHTTCFTLARYVRPQPWGPPAVLLATCAIMRFRPPPTPLDSAKKKKTKTKTKA